jgi:hypothetical protein
MITTTHFISLYDNFLVEDHIKNNCAKKLF